MRGIANFFACFLISLIAISCQKRESKKAWIIADQLGYLHQEIKIAVPELKANPEFQPELAAYHDDYMDFSTNEPTMDGTASLIYLLAAIENKAQDKKEVKKK